ncbi:hypothetical protein BDV96DRAFT_653487 [Lophiotrema nucula]|uniref:RING-type domain-containing protein n=1 Tax=Lophiotrema nucula TaxID=690887 RepID=A0A6A5YMY5_9PLEO|nr:hypothetical protein BDV96DRAFT_653487 [Lophiotrema nucula]
MADNVITFADILAFSLPEPIVFEVCPTYREKLNEHECFICKEPYAETNERSVKVIPCKHVVGYTCLTMWLARNLADPRCPYCSGPILTKDHSGTCMKVLKWLVKTVFFEWHDTRSAALLGVEPRLHFAFGDRAAARKREIDYLGAVKIILEAFISDILGMFFIEGTIFEILMMLIWLFLRVDPSWLHLWFMRMVVTQALMFEFLAGCVLYVAVRERKVEKPKLRNRVPP